MNHIYPAKTKSTETKLLQLVNELDRLIHRVHQPNKKIPSSKIWASLRGLWTAKIHESPLDFQRRIRSEE